VDYYNIIQSLESYWEEEINNPNSPFFSESNIRKSSWKYFKRWGTTIEKILNSIKGSVTEKRKWYYSEKELAGYFKTSVPRISNSLKLITQNMGMLLIGLPSRFEFEGNDRTFSEKRYYLAPPNFCKKLKEIIPDFDYRIYRIELTFTSSEEGLSFTKGVIVYDKKYGVKNSKGGYRLTPKGYRLTPKGYRVIPKDQGIQISASPYYKLPIHYTIQPIDYLCMFTAYAVNYTRRENASRCDPFFQDYKEQAKMTSKRLKLTINSKYKTAKQKAAELKQERILIANKPLTSKRYKLKTDIQITAADYGVKDSKLYTKVELHRFLQEALDYVRDNNVYPIDEKDIWKFLNYWNAVDNNHLAKKSPRVTSQSFAHLKLALTYRLHSNKISIVKCMKAIDNFSLFAKSHGQLKRKRKNLDPLNDFLFNTSRTRPWFNICLKSQEEARQEVFVKTTDFKLTSERVTNLFSEYFYGGNKKLANREITTNYSAFVDWIDFLVDEHQTNHVGGMRVEEYLKSFFEFLRKFKSGRNFRPTLAYLTKKDNLINYYGQMIEDTGDLDFGTPKKVLLARKKKEDKIQEEYDRLNPDKAEKE
jgi:hypothetical protein